MILELPEFLSNKEITMDNECEFISLGEDPESGECNLFCRSYKLPQYVHLYGYLTVCKENKSVCGPYLDFMKRKLDSGRL